MACLSYNPSEIVIEDREYKREEVLEISTKILQFIKGRLGENGSGGGSNSAMMSPEGCKSEILIPVGEESINPYPETARKEKHYQLPHHVQITEIEK